jgi:hypothetical protein
MFGQYEAISALGYGVIGNKQIHGALSPTERRGSLGWSLSGPGYVGDEAGRICWRTRDIGKRVRMTEVGPRRSLFVPPK